MGEGGGGGGGGLLGMGLRLQYRRPPLTIKQQIPQNTFLKSLHPQASYPQQANPSKVPQKKGNEYLR